MEIIFKYIPIMFIAVTVLNVTVLKFRSKKYVSKNIELEEGYDKYFRGLIIYGNIPWVIMTIGNLSGITDSVFEYFNPKAMNPIVLIFHFSIIVIWGLILRFIYFKKGAEFFETHPGLIQKKGLGRDRDLTAKEVKMFFLLMFLSGIIGLIMMWIIEFPT